MREKKYISRNNEKGFTLIEVLVAIGILSFGLLAVAAMQNTAILGTGRSKSVTEATTVAMDRMERIFALPFDTLTTKYVVDTDYGDDDLDINPPSPLPSNIESVTWKISDPDAASPLPAASTKIIEVTVKSKSMQTSITLKNLKLKIS